MRVAANEPKLLIPGLRRFYDFAEPLTWPLIRVACGGLFIIHGWDKWTRGMEAQAELLAQSGWDMGETLAIVLFILEFAGGVCLLLGLMTRFWAAALAVEMGVLTFYQYWGNGFSWVGRGYEFTLLWGVVCLAIALRGGREYSLDRALGREL